MNVLVPALILHHAHAWGNSLLNELPTIRQSKGCQDSELHIACPDGDVISILKVFYGRRDQTLCAAHPSEIPDKNCRSNPIAQVQTRCNNQASCRIAVDSTVFNDPCPDTRKYLQVEFECVKHLFTYPGKYLVSQTMSEFSTTETESGSVWTTDPLSKSYKLYQLRFTQYTNKVLLFNSFDDFKFGRSASTITLPIAAADAKLVVWDDHIYYLSSTGKKLIKYSIRSEKQISTLDLTKKVSNSGLFAPILDLSTSEAGIFGVYKEEDTFKILNIDASTMSLKIKEEYSIQKPKFHKDVVSGHDQTLIIGNNFYVVRNGKFIHAVNLVSKSTFDVENDAIQIDELLDGPETFIAYSPAEHCIQQSSPNVIRQINLTFYDAPPIRVVSTIETTSRLPVTTNKPAPVTPTVAQTIPKPTQSSEECNEIEQGGIVWPRSLIDSDIRRNCPNGHGFARWRCDQNAKWAPMDGPDLTECNIITPEPTSDGLYDNWPPSISALFQSKDLTGVLNELEREIAKQNNEGKIVQLVETVSRKLVNSKGNLYEMAFLKSLLNVFEQLHCWSLVDSESFLYLMANVGDRNYDGNGSDISTVLQIFDGGRLFQPSRCDVDVQYVLFVRSKRQDYSSSENAVCSFFSDAHWQNCISCDQCPSALFFKIEKEEQSILFSPLYISNLFSIIVIGALLILVMFSSSDTLLYPGQLRTMLIVMTLVGQLSLLMSPVFGIVSASVSALRDATLSLSIIGQFQLALCISHALHQRAKVVSSPDGVKVRTYLLLVVITSLLVVLSTFIVFLVSESGTSSQFAGWLHLGWAWSSSLLAPISVSALFSFGWLIQSSAISSSIRPHSIKVALFIFGSLLSSASLLSSFSIQGSNISSKLLIDWCAALFMILWTISTVFAFFPDRDQITQPIQQCLRHLALLPSQDKRGQPCQTSDANEAWLVADNRTSLAEFRYIPVVHNIHSHSYVKPRTNCSIDRIYTEIVPNSTVYSPQTIQPIAFHTEKIRHVNDLSMNWNTAPMLEDLSYKDNNRHREDSGVHTAHNSSDSERNSPVQLDDKEVENQSLLRNTHNASTPVNI